MQHARCTCSRCASCSEVEVDHVVFYRFLAGKHINLLELGSLISLLRRITRAGIWEKTALGACGVARGLGSRLKRTVELTKIQFLASKTGFWCLAYDIALELVWVPTWANPADAPSRSNLIESWYGSLRRCPSTPTAVLASAPALSELDLLREPLSVAAHRAGEDVRKLESTGAFSCSEMKPAYVGK